LEKTDDALIILLDNYEFYQGYFFARNISGFLKIKEKLNRYKKPVLIDIIGKEQDAFEIVKQLEQYGVKLYSKYIRMVCNNLCEFKESKGSVVLAKNEDSIAIYNLLYEEFDHFDAHLPMLSEIEHAITKDEITVIKNENKIIGLAFFEILGTRSLYLRELMVVKGFRGKGIANELLQHTLSKKNSNMKVLLWVKSTNVSAIKKYEKFGFIGDELINYIMIYKGEEK
jgi:ribosomal protein S18 acetylase RimI-like enzyme